MADETRPSETQTPGEAPPGDTVSSEAEPAAVAPPGLGRITRVVLKNYKSIVSCDVRLEPLTLLVGPNGSGKSNFLDALAFVSEALTLGLDQAILKRGNLDRILSAARPPGDDSFSIQLDFVLGTGGTGSYSFEIGTSVDAGFEVRRERIDRFDLRDNLGQHLFWIREDGLTKWTSDPGLDMDPIEDARLFLLHLASDARIRPIYELLSNMAFYNPQPDQLRAPVEHDVAPRLSADGRNTASILGRVQDAETDDLHGVLPYLKRILPGLEAIKVEPFQGYDHLSFVLRQGDDRAAGLVASQMSDGTLRALAVLVALFQGRLGGRYAPSLVGVEEPENTIHPAAARILLAAMQNASYRTQVLATTHSADMLHMGNADMRSVLVVAAEDGITKIGPIDAVSQGIVRDNIYTLGELLQMDQLFPEPPAQAANGDAAAHQPAFGGA